MVTKERVTKIIVEHDGHIFVCRSTLIKENDETIAVVDGNRVGYDPGGQLAPEDAAVPLVKAITELVWTPEVVATHRAHAKAQADRHTAALERKLADARGPQ